MKGKYYLVREDILPEAILKTARVKEMLVQGEAAALSEAIAMVGLARSTYYKYREGVFPFFDAEHTRIVNLSLALRHQPGMLSKVLNLMASHQGNILTINQGLPLQGKANVTLSIDVENLNVGLRELLEELAAIEGVLETKLIGRN